MVKMIEKPTLECRVTLELSDAEVRALDYLAQYGPEKVADIMAERVTSRVGEGGEHRAAFVAILQQARNLRPFLERADNARSVFVGTHEAVQREPRP